MNLKALADVIYHEQQQCGSMLCAQHALNSLLQGNYFTAPDLAHIANSFDALELDEASRQTTSTNMDDTGFFSVQVMEEALKVWNLNLVRWRSEEMRPHNSEPYKQLAFVLNLQQHWFTLRRFGPASPDFTKDSGEGHWFNLNSTSFKPQWISKTYLGIVLQQSEDEGYSVFAVVQADPNGDLALPRMEADTIAAAIPAPDTNDLPTASSGAGASGSGGAAGTAEEPIDILEVTDELDSNDMELQAALQASLTGGQFGFAWKNQDEAGLATRLSVRASESVLPNTVDKGMEGMGDVDESSDPVAVSMARNRATLANARLQYISRGLLSLTSNMANILQEDKHKKAFLKCIKAEEFANTKITCPDVKTRCATFARFVGHLMLEATLVAHITGYGFVERIATEIQDPGTRAEDELKEENMPNYASRLYVSWASLPDNDHKDIFQVGQFYLNIMAKHAKTSFRFKGVLSLPTWSSSDLTTMEQEESVQTNQHREELLANAQQMLMTRAGYHCELTGKWCVEAQGLEEYEEARKVSCVERVDCQMAHIINCGVGTCLVAGENKVMITTAFMRMLEQFDEGNSLVQLMSKPDSPRNLLFVTIPVHSVLEGLGLWFEEDGPQETTRKYIVRISENDCESHLRNKGVQFGSYQPHKSAIELPSRILLLIHRIICSAYHFAGALKIPDARIEEGDPYYETLHQEEKKRLTTDGNCTPAILTYIQEHLQSHLNLTYLVGDADGELDDHEEMGES